LLFEIAEGIIAAIPGVHVHHEETACLAGRYPDIRIRPAPPPSSNRGFIGGGVLEPVFCSRVFAG
jgi:hypothetical protein